MTTSGLLSKLMLASAAILGVVALMAPNAAGQAPKSAPPAAQVGAAGPRTSEASEVLGGFTIGGQRYTVVARVRNISGASDAKFSNTLVGLEIRDAHRAGVYAKSFQADVQDGRFARILSASASAVDGAGGALLMIRYLEEPAAAGEGESWQVFAPVNGKLTLLGVPLPPGGNENLAVGGVVAGVMVEGGVNVMPLVSKAEPLEFRAWAGNFFVYVPVRVDWEHGQWGEGEQCFKNDKGSLEKTGCNMRITAVAQPSRAQGSVVTLYEAPVEDRFHASQVPIESGTKFEIVDARAVVKWKESGERVSCQFEDMWLHVRFHGDLGWIHSETDFAALGLPVGNPPE